MLRARPRRRRLSPARLPQPSRRKRQPRSQAINRLPRDSEGYVFLRAPISHHFSSFLFLSLLALFLRLGLQVQCRRIHAVALSSGRRPVFKNMSQMGVAARATGLRSNHAVTLISVGYHDILGQRLAENLPPRAWIKTPSRAE